MTLTLLGPQRFRPSVGNVVRGHAPEGTVATITAGWQEREPDDAELDALLDGRSVNLGLYGRWLAVQEHDPEYAAAERQRRDVLDELQSAYVLRVDRGLQAVNDLLLRDIHAPVAIRVLEDAIAHLRDLDHRHLELVAEVHAEFYTRMPPHDRPVIAEHRAAVADVLANAAAVAIAGGHIGALLHCLHLFNIGAALAACRKDCPIVAWSAGAMALTTRVVLFNDRAPDGRSYAEVYDAGLDRCKGAVLLPHARRRLRLDDPLRVLVMARRFAPDRCIVLDDGIRIDWPEDGCCPPGVRVLTPDGRVEAVEELAA